MSEKGTITIKKDSLWKYSTFILLAIVIVGAFIFFGKNNSSGNAVASGGIKTAGDLRFIEDSKLYPSIGPKNAKVTVVEFSDFQCPFCAMASGLPEFAKQYESQYGDLIGSAQKVEDLAKEGKIRFVYGIMSFLGAESGYAAEAGLCANEQEKFFEMHEAIFTAHDGKENNGKYSKENLKILAKGINELDQSKFADCLTSGKYASAVQTLSKNANSVGVSGTPTFFVNGAKSSGSWTELSSKISSEGVSL